MTREDFFKEYNAIADRVLFLKEKCRREGVLAAEADINEAKYNQRDIMEYGMRFVVDGVKACLIDKILTNIINLETDNDRKTLKTIQKEAVLAIQEGQNSLGVLYLLNSYVDMGSAEVMQRFEGI
jgi:flagellar motor component MotA